VLAASGCGSSPHDRAAFKIPSNSFKLPPDYVPVPVGRGPGFRLRALSAAAVHRRPIDGLRCVRTHERFYGIHVEVYADRLVLPIPSAIGIAPPLRRSGVYVHGGSCSYPLRTFEPTGVVVVDSGGALTAGTLFDVWGQRLASGALAGLRGHVLAFVDGRRWTGQPRTIPLRRHAEIVLEIGGYVVPHPAYRFPPGL
jgi:hypothetical protein